MRKLNIDPYKTNCFVSGGITYTEDHVPVKKLYVGKVPNDVTMEQLRHYFERFGKIDNLMLLTNMSCGSHSSISKAASLIFANSCDATNVLVASHTLNGKRLCVRASDSWHQPDVYDAVFQEEDSDGEDEMPLIFKLNDDCMKHVFNYLKLQDQVRFARTCCHFKRLYKYFAPVSHKSVRFEDFDSMTVWDMRDFFHLSGSYIKSIQGKMPLWHQNRFVRFFFNNCTNVKIMHLKWSDIRTCQLFIVFPRLKDLEELTLKGCNMHNNDLLALKTLKSLKYLDISYNNNIGGTEWSMNHLPSSIETLILRRCENLHMNNLPTVCKILPNLKKLDLKYIQGMTTNLCKDFVSMSDSLETLIITAVPQCDYEYLANLRSLKTLIIHFVSHQHILIAQLFVQLAALKSNQLQHLEVRGNNWLTTKNIDEISKIKSLRILMLPNNNLINNWALVSLHGLTNLEQLNVSNCPSVCDISLIRLLLACPKLHILYVERCPELSQKLIMDAIEKLGIQIRRNVNQRKLPITLYVYKTNIKKSILEDCQYLSGKHIVDIVWGKDPATNETGCPFQ